MTYKEQIMIDGIDVSKCRYFCRYDDLCRDDNIGRVVRPLCKRIPDCYFKQLARKTQECEELKKKCNIYTCGICGNKEDCNKLYKTLTEIKEIIQSDYCTEIGSCEFCAEVGNCLNRKILQKISECEVNND